MNEANQPKYRRGDPHPTRPNMVWDGSHFMTREAFDRHTLSIRSGHNPRRIFGIRPDGTRGYIGMRPKGAPVVVPAEFTPGPSGKTKAETTIAPHFRPASIVKLDHTPLQRALYLQLVEQYGCENVSEEQPTGHGTYIDIAVRCGDAYWIYEVKPIGDVCMAVGQLLVYAAQWHKPERLIVATPNAGDAAIVDAIRNQWGLPVYHERLLGVA